jgi:hypothetical protein
MVEGEVEATDKAKANLRWDSSQCTVEWVATTKECSSMECPHNKLHKAMELQ